MSHCSNSREVGLIEDKKDSVVRVMVVSSLMETGRSRPNVNRLRDVR